jgi:hypothetical protein
MTLSLMCDENWKTLLGCLPQDYKELAFTHKQLLTQYGNAKIRDADTLLRFIFLHAGADLPLRQTVTLMAEAGGPRLSPMRLHKKALPVDLWAHDATSAWGGARHVARIAGAC